MEKWILKLANLRSLLVNVNAFVWRARKGFNPALDLWMCLRGGEVLRWVGERVVLRSIGLSLRLWTDAPSLCSFLVDFLPWIITHVKPHTLDILRGRSKRKGCNCANSSGQETRGTMSFGQNKLLFGVLVLIILAVVSWRDTYRVAERCLSARGRKSISYKTLRVLTRIYTEQIAINSAVWWMASGLYFIAWF